ncbi:multiple epidermal growth factor-like domains protein 11 [Dysidea avara]|uniref:multiple epidermal growth factor-like domains protein 11 n=1 Tax=Dysidea avara TaxID=196820 RepID=UPI003328070B
MKYLSGKLSSLAVLLLIILLLLLIKRSHQQGVCYRVTTRHGIERRTRTTHYKSYHRYRCGGWLSRKRCTGETINYKKVDYYAYVTDYVLSSYCCKGYTGSAPSCRAVCYQTCHNFGTCVKPDTCACSTGWTGRDCQTPTCHQECNNHGRCTKPNTCTCAPGWTGYDCRIQPHIYYW